MTTQTQGRGTPRRLRAAIIGLGLDGPLRPTRIIHGEECMVIGGSEQTRESLLEVMLRMEGELERMGRSLGELDPSELRALALRIDSPELESIADRLEDGLKTVGRSFGESTPEELTALASYIA